MADVPTWEALFERGAREEVDVDDVRATLAAIRDEQGDRDG